jgi:tRNA (cytidine56-2'-O)-methyltransferase
MITVLRLGHRKKRDARISTHLGLAARAFGASGIVYAGEPDDGLLLSVSKVAQHWGGPFSVAYSNNWKKTVKGFDGKVVHLTMYGLPLQAEIRKIRKHRKIMVVVGGEKVPGDVYGMADYNVSVTGQPHSEVAALAVFLHEYFGGKELSKRYRGAELRIVPQKAGKRVIGTR